MGVFNRQITMNIFIDCDKYINSANTKNDQKENGKHNDAQESSEWRQNSKRYICLDRFLIELNLKHEKASAKLTDRQTTNSHKRPLSENKNTLTKRSTEKDHIRANKNLANKTQNSNRKSAKKSIKRQKSFDENSKHSGIAKKNIYTKGKSSGDENLVRNTKEGKSQSRKKSRKTPNSRTEHNRSETSSQSSNRSHNRLQTSCDSFAPSSFSTETNRLKVSDLVADIKEEEFENLHTLKLKILSFIFKNRIIKDEQYDELFELATGKFPEKEDLIRGVLFEIVCSLDS